MEVELFGSRKGAYTDSKRDRKGFFEVCSKGTLMLDEIGEMPLELQAKLLRVLQEREVTPVGSCDTVQVNTRVIAVTNCDLEELVRLGKFRKDLYYRLAVVKLSSPSLRTISDDIEFLVRYFFQKYNRQFNKSVKLPNSADMAKLKAYDWPGNVRELQNAVERGVLFAEQDEAALEDLLPPISFVGQDILADEAKLPAISSRRDFASNDASELERAEASAPFSPPEMPLHYLEAKKYFEKQYLEFLLGETRGVIAQAAEVSGQYRPNLYRMIKKYDIDVDAFKL
jgi:DNA-binding NtrC family response regulator